jgi:hypothetical protein
MRESEAMASWWAAKIQRVMMMKGEGGSQTGYPDLSVGNNKNTPTHEEHQETYMLQEAFHGCHTLF